ncbi:MAG: hypothetical protein O3A00_11425 [Planctomycetota bacterium]|nr:hypothetical protein [Planctomycetota bacterium]
MKLAGRRMTFQLTPLLDLLLIVIFAQFMEVDQAAEQTQSEAKQQTLDAVAVREKLAKLSTELVQVTARAKTAESERAEIEQQAKNLEQQQQQFGDLVGELFQVPEATVNKTIKTLDTATAAAASLANPLPKPKVQELREAFRQMAAHRGRDAVRHVLVHHQMAKRLELWEIYIDRVGRVRFQAGDKTFNFQFRDDDSDSQDETEAKFIKRVYTSYQSLKPHGKSVVILLVTFDRKISYLYLRPILRALPQITDRMQRDSLGSAHYEFAVMGDLGQIPVTSQE